MAHAQDLTDPYTYMIISSFLTVFVLFISLKMSSGPHVDTRQ